MFVYKFLIPSFCTTSPILCLRIVPKGKKRHFMTIWLIVQPEEAIIHRKWMKIKLILDAFEDNPFCSLYSRRIYQSETLFKKDLSNLKPLRDPESERISRDQSRSKRKALWCIQTSIQYKLLSESYQNLPVIPKHYFKVGIYVTNCNSLISSGRKKRKNLL